MNLDKHVKSSGPLLGSRVYVRFRSYIIPFKLGWDLGCKCKSDQADFTGWMSFLPSNVMV